ncbi:hydrolase family protein / HAD-superfamily protein [Melia azedarach]|uniref:Hydrolase family protein / HAD-superfamily protein n=1 Tax=Melia azedarach TaxID=155640 RepID=A0ACC1YSC9_MELAZ|nr:hydrolase family protein / HAD-superfamily protein [Melia azedarach]
MRLSILSKALRSQDRKKLSPPVLLFSAASRSFSQLSSQYQRPSFGIAFDIDGVILLGNSPIGGSDKAIKRLYQDSGNLRIPYIFLTNGGGFPESKRASELSKLLGVNILPSQVVQGHSPFKQLVNRFENEFIVAVGKGEPAAVMSAYGFKNVLSMDEYTSYFDNIDPLAQYKKWTITPATNENSTFKEMAPTICSQRVQAAFIVSDPVDWSRDIQVLCDILRTGGLPGREIGHQPHLYFANDDLEYQATFPSERLGMGAFRIALESIFNRIHPNPLAYTSFGKPSPLVFQNAELVLKKLLSSVYSNSHLINHATPGSHNFKTLYMVGDNPSVDIKGARQAGQPWFSILTRTGVFKGKENHAKYPADLVVDTVEEAIDYILRKESI